MSRALAHAAQLRAHGESLTFTNAAGDDESVQGALVPVDAALVDGVTVQASDRVAYCAATDFSGRPEPGSWTFKDSGVHKSIVRVGSFRVAGSDVAYEIVVRGS